MAVLLVISIFGLGRDQEEDFGSGSIKTVTGEALLKKVEENKIFLAMKPIRSLNPAISKDQDSFYFSRLIYDSLFTVDRYMRLQKELVKEYRYDDDALTIELKTGAKWHDGKGRVTSEDVAFSVDVIKAVGKEGPFSYKAGAILGLEIIDKNKFRIFFEDQDNRGLDLLTFPIFPKHQYSGLAEFINKKEDFYPIGSGPYECTSLNQEKLISLKPFSDYHGRKARSKIKVKFFDSQERINKLVEASNISLTKDSDYTRESKVTKEGVSFKNYPNGRIIFIGFNSNEKHFESSEVKKAIAMAIDNKSIVSDCFYNSAMRSDSMFRPRFMGSEKRQDPYKKDLEKAEAALEVAGYRDTNGDGIVENEDYQTLSLSLLLDSSKDQNIEIGEMIQNDLKTVGVDVSLIKAEGKTYRSYLRRGNFSMYLGSINVDEGYDLRNILKADGEYNFIGYKNDQLEESYDRMRSGNHPKKVKLEIESIKKIIDEDLPYYCIAHETCGIMLSPATKGSINPNFSDIYRGAEGWYSVYERRIEQKRDKE